jgi:hypothetical protein
LLIEGAQTLRVFETGRAKAGASLVLAAEQAFGGPHAAKRLLLTTFLRRGGAVTMPSASPRPPGLAALLACGITAALLYASTDVVASMSWEEYRAADQGVSELMGLGAPTRPLLVAAYLPFGALILAFGVGVWRAAGDKRGLRVAGALLVVYAVVGTIGLFSPVHPRGTEFSGTDVRHIIATSALVLLTFLFIAFGSGA